jgi:hypothetical protein
MSIVGRHPPRAQAVPDPGKSTSWAEHRGPDGLAAVAVWSRTSGTPAYPLGRGRRAPDAAAPAAEQGRCQALLELDPESVTPSVGLLQELFGSERPRLEAGLEFHAYYLLGNPVPSSVCGGQVTLAQRPTFEIGYNEYHNRLGDSLPNTLQWLVSNVRAQSLPVDNHMMVFETLTHGAKAGGVKVPDFSLSATPASQSVTAGGTATYTVTVTPSNGYGGTVALSVGGLPSGATASFNPASIGGGSGSSTLTVATSSGTPAGTSALTITGADSMASLSHTAGVSLTVEQPVCVQTTQGGPWQNSAFANQTGMFTVQFDATPSMADMNGVIGLSNGVQTAYTGVRGDRALQPDGGHRRLQRGGTPQRRRSHTSRA